MQATTRSRYHDASKTAGRKIKDFVFPRLQRTSPVNKEWVLGCVRQEHVLQHPVSNYWSLPIQWTDSPRVINQSFSVTSILRAGGSAIVKINFLASYNPWSSAQHEIQV